MSGPPIDEPVADPHRIDPAEHRGHDVGILDRRFTLPADRRDNDHRGPRPLPRRR